MQYTYICAIIYASLCPVIFEYSTLKSRPISCKILKIEKALVVRRCDGSALFPVS